MTSPATPLESTDRTDERERNRRFQPLVGRLSGEYAARSPTARSSSGAQTAVWTWNPECSQVSHAGGLVLVEQLEPTKNRGTARRNASVKRAVRCAGHDTKVPSDRKRPSVTKRYRCGCQFASAGTRRYRRELLIAGQQAVPCVTGPHSLQLRSPLKYLSPSSSAWG